MPEDKSGAGSKSRPTVQIVVAVAIALLAGGTSPWWWKELKEMFRPPSGPPPITGEQRGSGETTPPPPPQLRQVSQGKEILRGSATLDLDAGAVGGDTGDADLFWRITDDQTRHLVTQNNAALFLVGASDLSRVAAGDMLSAEYAPASLNGSPNAANQIPDGTVLLVKTTKGRYSKVRIEQYGIAAPGDLPTWPKSALLVRWETYAPD